MSTIDEIMGAIGRHGDDCIRDADSASESFEALREMIAAALPAGTVNVVMDREHGGLTFAPAKRQAVLLTDEQILELEAGCGHARLHWDTRLSIVRAAELAVLAANNLEVRRG